MPNYRITTGLPQLPPSAYDEKDFNKFVPVYQALNAIARAVSVQTGQVDFSQAELAERNQLGSLISGNNYKVYPLANGNLSFGLLVNLYVSGGKIVARAADPNLGRPAHGIVNVPTGIVDGTYGEVLFMEGHCLGISGTTFGTQYYATTSGLVTSPAPSGIVQPIGWGLGSLGLYLRIMPAV